MGARLTFLLGLLCSVAGGFVYGLLLRASLEQPSGLWELKARLVERTLPTPPGLEPGELLASGSLALFVGGLLLMCAASVVDALNRLRRAMQPNPPSPRSVPRT